MHIFYVFFCIDDQKELVQYVSDLSKKLEVTFATIVELKAAIRVL